MKHLKFLIVSLVAAALLGCGGGGGNAGTSSGGTSGVSTADAAVVSFPISMDKSTLSNSGSDKVTLTVVALDVNNNPVAGVTVKGSVDSGVYTPASKVTDAAGKFTATVEIGADKTNRSITATITINAMPKTVTIPVIGSQITITPVPATPAPGQAVRIDIRVVDAIGTGIPGVVLQLSGTAGFTGNVSSDISGNVSASGVAPASAGSYAVSAAGSGVTASKTIQVISAAGNTIPAALSLGAAQSLNANPTSIAPNIDGGTTNRAKLSAKFLDTSNGGIANMRVRFEIVLPGLVGSGESISTGSALVYSDAAGLAEADYVSGTRTSPTNGVKVRACYATTDAALANAACPQFVTATLTVNSQPLAISIGNYNKLETAANGTLYVEKFVVQVADASGLAVPDAVVSASVDIRYYGKGAWANGATTSSAWAATCGNEDLNRNGTLEGAYTSVDGVDHPSEDVNGNMMLDPGKSDIILSYVDGNKTNAQGWLLVQVQYAQDKGSWLQYAVKATTAVVGSEGTKERIFNTNVLEADVKNGSFRVSPYGVASVCTDPN
jgi:hypothetical protein